MHVPSSCCTCVLCVCACVWAYVWVCGRTCGCVCVRVGVRVGVCACVWAYVWVCVHATEVGVQCMLFHSGGTAGYVCVEVLALSMSLTDVQCHLHTVTLILISAWLMASLQLFMSSQNTVAVLLVHVF